MRPDHRRQQQEPFQEGSGRWKVWPARQEGGSVLSPGPSPAGSLGGDSEWSRASVLWQDTDVRAVSGSHVNTETPFSWPRTSQVFYGTEPSSSETSWQPLENGLGGECLRASLLCPSGGASVAGATQQVLGGAGAGGRAGRCGLRGGGPTGQECGPDRQTASPSCFIHGQVSENMDVGHVTLCLALVAS